MRCDLIEVKTLMSRHLVYKENKSPKGKDRWVFAASTPHGTSLSEIIMIFIIIRHIKNIIFAVLLTKSCFFSVGRLALVVVQPRDTGGKEL